MIEKIDGEIGKLVLQFELHASREVSRAFEQTDDQRIAAVFQERAQPLGDLGEFLSELSEIIREDGEFSVVEIQEELTIHLSRQPIDLDLAGVEFDLGDELHGNIDRMGRPVRLRRQI